MPVDVLLCEGVPRGRDIRLINAILHSTVRQIQPAGGKRDLPRFRAVWRDLNPTASIMCLRDCDFERPPPSITHQPHVWEYQGEPIGWHWERKEVENYLIDPQVVQQALVWSDERIARYRQDLEAAVITLEEYTAARATLSAFRRVVEPLENSWGEEAVGLSGHRLPSDRSEQICRLTVGSMVRGRDINAEYTPDRAVTAFNQLRTHYCGSGYRAQHFLTYYAGKDILGAMRVALVQSVGVEPGAFCERLLQALDRADEPWTWLPNMKIADSR